MKSLLAALAALLFCAPAFAGNGPDTAVVTGPTFQQMPIGNLFITINGSQQTLLNAVSNPSVQTFNNWKPLFGLTYSATTIVAGGTGNATGDVLTLNDGCATHGTLVVTGVTGGAVNLATVTAPGQCVVVPTGQIGVLSTSGSGTGASFTLNYAPYASGITVAPNDVGGNTFLAALPASGYAGQESVLLGNNAGSNFTGASNFNTCMGISACGGGGGVAFVGSGITGYGTDACRDLAAAVSGIDCYGSSALYSQSYATNAISVFGTGAAYYLNVNHSPMNLEVFGPNACKGVNGTAAFHDALCMGTKNGAALTTAFYFTFLGNNVANTTFASGEDVFLAGTGYAAVDTPAANTTHWMNLNNTIVQSMVAPTVSSGFGTSPTIPNGASSAAFQVNVGTGGTASSGVIAFATAAPHGWACDAVDGTTTSTSVFVTKSVPTSTTTVTLTNYSDVAVATAWAASDVLTVTCNGF